MTINKINESGYTRLQKIQFMLANGGRSIISALVNTAYIKFYTDFIGLEANALGIVFLVFSIWASAQWGIRLATGLMPAVMIAIGLFFLWKYPINKQKEDEIETEMLARHRVS